jgi:serine/threonine protein kinase/tetratricopeptide (TPR) repeat protein
VSIRLGSFLLERPIARGGMAEVWRGVHEGEELPVAVKVLTGPRARDAAFIGALKNEIHAVARLNHPGIILVYDRGSVDAAAAAASAGRLVEGSPWFAMEMCTHGALSPRRFPLPWPTTRTLLLSLLDALAHAHARGVIHRDLKPGNVLLCAPTDPRPGLKLSDFGIAHPLGILAEDAARDAHSGTPRYMAPEQFTGAARTLGPWTDLYAVGCLAWQLAVGQAPFAGDALRLAVAHCHDPVPPMGERPGYPDGYEAWVLRLLEKEPRHRYTAAADAAWGLLQLSVDGEATVSSDWEGALHSLRPRPMFPDEDPSGTSPGHDDTAAHTLGPARPSEHPSLDYTPAPPPGFDESTGPLREPLPGRTGVDGADRTDEPTAVARRALPSRIPTHLPEPVLPTSPTAPTGAPVGVGRLEIASDDPFAAVLGADDARSDDDGDDPPTDPRTWAPQAPWTELLAMQEAAVARDVDRDHPTIGGPFAGFDAPTTSMRGAQVDRRLRAPALPPPSVPSWRRDVDLALSPAEQRLIGAGLGLFGLRQVPFVGRVAERDRLWATLSSARAGRDHVVVVRGAAGVGRTRLLQWFGERAAEVGAATTLWGTHAPVPGPLDGLFGAMARALRLRLTPGEDVAGILRATLRSLDDDDVHTLAWALGGEPMGRVDRRAERFAAVIRGLRILARKRPVVLILDDAQWGDDALAFARRLVATEAAGGGCGLIAVLAVSDEAAAERSDIQQDVDALVAADAVVTVPLPPLPRREHRSLVDHLLGLEPRLADEVAVRTAGNPRFAVEIVGALVERGSLEPGPGGFALRHGEVVDIPDNVHAVWATRLERLLAQVPAAAREALELGAVLGDDGDTADWVGVCGRAGIADAAAIVGALVDVLERARFVVVDPSQGSALRFAHTMLRESMKRLAREGGRLASHHRVVAGWLEQRGQRDDGARRARHLLAAADLAAALPALFVAVDRALRSDGCVRAGQLVDETFSALDRAGVGDDDPRRLRAIALRARVLAEAGRYDESAMWANLVDVTAPRAARIDALRAAAVAAVRKGDLDASVATHQALLVLASGDDDAADGAGEDSDAVDDALLGLADAHYYTGSLKDADAVLSRALARMQARGDDAAVATCLWNLAYVALWRGDPAAARACALRASALARAERLPTLMGLTRNALGDIERIAGTPADARRHYDEARAALARAGSGKVRTVEVNQGLCALADGAVDAAVAVAEQLLPLASRAGEAVLSSLCHGILAVAAARAADWSLADAHLQAFLTPHQQGLVDGEHALLAEAFAKEALRHGETWRAGVAVNAARDVWTGLGRDERLETLPS